MSRRLYRSRNEKMIGGVAGGLADYLDVDPVLVRVAFAVAFFASGFGFLAYILLWILVPQQPWHMVYPMPGSGTASDQGAASFGAAHHGAVPPPSHRARTWSASTIIGSILVIVGSMSLIENFIPDLDLDIFWPLVLIGLGVGLLTRHKKSTSPVDADHINSAPVV